MNPLTRLKERLNRLEDDERAVSPVIGFVLIFALIMIVFTLYQTNVVPAQNSKVEFQHSQTVETQMSQLNDAIKATSADGVPHSQTIATGMQYPSRALFINPGPPTGTLHTVNESKLYLDGINIAGSAYWDGHMNRNSDPKKDEGFSNLKSLKYTIDYNEQQNNPTLSLDDGILTKGYGNGNTLTVGDQSNTLISGRRINLYLMGGDYQQSAASASPTAKPISTSTHYLDFKSDGNSEIPIDSRLSSAECTDKWERILGNDFSSTGSDHQYWSVTCNGGGNNFVKLAENTQFSIRITKIGFGDVTQSTPWEVVPTETSSVTIDGNVPTADLDAEVDKPTSFTVAVRDKYGNPIQADLTASGGGSSVDESNIKQTSLTTNENGKATFTYTPGSGGDKTIDISIDGVNTDYDTATYKFHIPKPGSGDGSDDGNGDNFVPGPPTFEKVESITDTSIISFDIKTTKPIEIEGFAIETKYALSNLTKTNRTHSFEVNQRSVSYSPPDGQPIQFDGRRYDFTTPAKDVTHSDIQINEFSTDFGDPSVADIVLTDFVDSPRKADLEVIFFLGDGSQRAVYIDGYLK